MEDYMEWFRFLGYLIAIFTGIKWVLLELKFFKDKAEIDRREMLQSMKNIEKEVSDLHKVIHPIEKRHFR
jgi:hypothetical protein